MSPSVITPSLRSSDITRLLADSEPKRVYEALYRDGVCIIEGLADPKILDKVRAEINSHAKSPSGRVLSLAGKSEAFARNFLTLPLFDAVCQRILRKSTVNTFGTEKVPSTATPQVSKAAARLYGSDCANSYTGLRRDDQVHHTRHPGMRQSDLGLIIAGTKATDDNGGAEQFLIGSHNYSDETEPERNDCVSAELEKGDAVIW